MSATNHTTNYELPIFVGSDKPAWLVDWNGAMTAIDTAIHQAEGKADQAGTDIGGIESSISTINSTLASLNGAVSQLRTDTNANTGSINTITSLIGNGEPTTTDKTLIGAINELNAIAHDLGLTAHTGSLTLTANSAYGSITSDDRSLVKYAFNDDKSLGKIYGGIYFMTSASMTAPWTKIVTLSSNDIPEIDASYYIEIGSGFVKRGDNAMAGVSFRLKFNTDKTIDLEMYGGTDSGSYIPISLPPCLYILKDFGD